MLIDVLIMCIAKHFEAVFTLARKSLYRNAWSFVTGLYQKRVLTDIDLESRYDDHSDQVRLKANNPCHSDDEQIRVFFTGIDIIGEHRMYSDINYLYYCIFCPQRRR